MNQRFDHMPEICDGCRVRLLGDRRLGAQVAFESSDVDEILHLVSAHAARFLKAFYQARGLLVLKGLQGIREQPAALVELSRWFGPEVENYRQTLTSPRFFHDSVDEILILTNAEPCRHPPPPKAELDEAGRPAIRFPLQVNWHTDQSYRRPPPDITLLLGLDLPPQGQGQTLFADCTAAYQALAPVQQRRLAGMQGIHAPSWIGRSRAAVEAGETPVDLLPHQLPQRQPLVRHHPVTGEHSLFICEEKQMDFVDGPIVGLSTGPDGEGAAFVRELLQHATRDEFVYVHEWEAGDLVIADNRNLLHCATWYDAERYTRLMWRTTVMGNPGKEYVGEEKTWIPRDGSDLMAGMDNA